MSRNLFKKLSNPESHIALNPFDLSQRKIYSARAGMCIPTLALECVRGDRFSINTTVFNRTARLLAPAFFRCKQFNHFFFVPYNTLWHQWDTFFTRSTEKYSSSLKGNAYFPNFNLQLLQYYAQSTSEYVTTSDMMGFSAPPGIDRMLQMLHYGSFMSEVPYQEGSTPLHSETYCNLARILAYNKIWYWFYRDKKHTTASTYLREFEKYYNVDDVDCSSFATSHVYNQDRLQMMFMPKYRCWESDVFTNGYQNTQFGDVSIMSSDFTEIVNQTTASLTPRDNSTSILGSGSQYTDPPYRLVIRDNNSGNVVNNSYNWQVPNLFDILSLRRAEAIQHWRELMLRAGDSSKDRYRAMFGSNPNRSAEVPTYIGGFDVNLNIDDVTSTASYGQDSALGDLAGKGIMVKDGETIKFDCPDYGILMCITTFLPQSEYDGNCIDKGNTLIEPTDFYIPQYDRLGFEPVLYSEEKASNSLASYTAILGYTVRNHYLKTAVDRVYNNFRSTKSMQYWTNPRTDPVLPIPNFSFRTFYVNPANLNPMFDRKVLTSTSDADSAYNQDQFMCMSYYQITALRPMSELGLPPM